MKHLHIIFLFVISGVFAVYPAASQTEIDFEVTGYSDSTIYVGYHFGNQKYLLDTLEVNNERFHLTTSATTGVYFLYSPNFYFEFILEEGSYTLKTATSEPYKVLEVTNSSENDLFKDFQMTMIRLQADQRRLMESADAEAQAELKALAKEMTDYRNQLIEENPKTFTAEFLRLMGNIKPPTYEGEPDSISRIKSYQYMVAHYFDGIDLSNSELLRTPLLHSKVMEYFDNLLIQSPDSINKGLDMLFARIGDNDELYRYWLVSLFKKYAESKIMGMDAVMIHLAKNYYLNGRADWISDEYKKQLREEVAYVQHNLIGEPAPPIEGIVDTLLEPVYLQQIESPYTLLFIYDPDCGHCKKAITKLEEHDTDFYELGVKVFALCTTTDVSRWKKFVSQANPDWTHAIDPSGKSYFRVYYNVRSTPQVYLLDGSKRIIAKKLEIGQFVDLIRNREGI